MNCIHELKERMKNYEEEKERSLREIEPHQERIDKLHIHIAKLEFLMRRVTDIIMEMENDSRTRTKIR